MSPAFTLRATFLRNEGLEFLGNGCVDGYRRLRDGVDELDMACEKGYAASGVTALRAIFQVALYAMADVCELAAYLMLSACEKVDFKQRVPVAATYCLIGERAFLGFRI